MGESGEGGGDQHYTWIYYNLFTSWLVLLGNMYVCVCGGGSKLPGGALIIISVDFFVF